MHKIYNNLYSAFTSELLTLTAENGHIRLCQKLKLFKQIFTTLTDMQDRYELKTSLNSGLDLFTLD